MGESQAEEDFLTVEALVEMAVCSSQLCEMKIAIWRGKEWRKTKGRGNNTWRDSSELIDLTRK